MATTLPNNILVNVQTYQKAQMAWMLNQCVAINLANKKFVDFQNRTANLGDTVTFDLAPRATAMNGLILSPMPAVQRQESLICSQAKNTSMAFDNSQLLFNVDDYMDRFGKSRIMVLANTIEEDILKTITGSMRVNNPKSPNYGNLVNPRSGPYRFYGDGTRNISTYQELAQAMADFRDYGHASYDEVGIVPVIAEPAICGSGQNVFTLDRNNRTAEKWEIGDFSGFRFTRSNLLPVHYAGTVGQSTTGGGNILTLISTNDPTGTKITELTLSGASASDAHAIKQGDLIQFMDGVSGHPNIRFRTFIGQAISGQPVQNRIIEDAESNGSGNVTIKLAFPLVSVANQDQNLSHALQPGMQIKVMNSYRAGVIMSGNPLYLAMPRMSDTRPFDNVTTTDEETGVSMRNYWGYVFGQDQNIFAWDQIYGATFIGENGMILAFPL